MPSTIAHAFMGLFTGLTLQLMTEGRFTGTHILLFTINSCNGPGNFISTVSSSLLIHARDIGSVIEWLFKGTVFGSYVMSIVHSPLYIISVGLLWAYIGVYISNYDFIIRNNNLILFRKSETQHHLVSLDGSTNQLKPMNNVGRLTFFKSWLLAVAGCFSHFLLDTVFENDDPLYKFILNTGFWGPGANDVQPAVAVAFILTLAALAIVMILIQSSINCAPFGNRLKRAETSLVLIIVIMLLYLIFVGLRLTYIPRIPAGKSSILDIDQLNLPFYLVGEEADFGVIIFMFITSVLPLLLCYYSCDSRI